ncbi:MAG: response regulator [Proteobacteria bacterium]|nr:response regulator [Pseudomonadota bacterium]MBU4297643.1 response regulator [Pseudomonadota bacterium]MCG2749995.1 response regulator [Desulfobulbaceae bacterium]
MNTVFRRTKTQTTLPARQLKALIVDDDEQIQRMLRRVFGQCHFAVDIARTCQEALGKAGARIYDLALVDVNLSDGNGLDLIEPIRKFSPLIEIISMTGDNPRALEAEARKHKVAYHLIKPIDFQELISVLMHISRRVRQSPFPTSLETVTGACHV